MATNAVQAHCAMILLYLAVLPYNIRDSCDADDERR